jgi:D-tyrosyl-tRNA(Tyr) deacylase
VARELWHRVADGVRRQGVEVGLGEFGAEMAVELVNDGPFTIWLDTADRAG